MPTPTYPFDTTGQAASNLIQNELHTVTEVNAATYRILIPEFAPFYLDNQVVEYVNTGGAVTPLVEGVDFYNVLPYVAASRSVGKPVYGGISLINNYVNGTVRLSAYQTLGGSWVADKNYVYEQLLLSQYNQRTTWWDMLTNVQDLFPPTPHNTNASDIQGHLDVIAKLEEIRQAILNPPTTQFGSFSAHLIADGNVHGLTKEDLGLQNVPNYPQATDQEVISHASVDKVLTLRQMLMLLQSFGIS